MRVVESLKVFVLGFLVYLSADLFFALGGRWFSELQNRQEWADRVAVLQRSFWKGVLLVIALVVSVLSIQWFLGYLRYIPDYHWIRLTAIVIALTATLGRGGWDIQSFKGRTVVERIDRGMFVISQLGATAILLFLLLF